MSVAQLSFRGAMSILLSSVVGAQHRRLSSACTSNLLDYFADTGMYAKQGRAWRGYAPGSNSMQILGAYPALPTQAEVQAAETHAGVDFCPSCTGSSNSWSCAYVHNAGGASWEGGHIHLADEEKCNDDDECGHAPCVTSSSSTSEEVEARVRVHTLHMAALHGVVMWLWRRVLVAWCCGAVCWWHGGAGRCPEPISMVAGMRLLLRYNWRLRSVAVLS